MTLYCKDFVGFVTLPDNTSTTNLLLKARYIRTDQEVTKIRLKLYIEGEFIWSKEYTAQDSIEINEIIPVEWRWGAAQCTAYIASVMGVYQPRYVVMVSVGASASITANTLTETCASITPSGGRLEATIVTSDAIVWFTGSPGSVLYKCGGLLEEGAVRATLVLEECNNENLCIESNYGLILYAVGPTNPRPFASLTILSSYSLST